VTPSDSGSQIDCSHPAPAAEIIDDMEDQTPGLSSSSAYATWYTYHDTTAGGHMTPEPNTPFQMAKIPGGRCASEYAMRASGSGFNDWGSGFGFDFGYGPQMPDGGTTILPVDGTPYDGIRFWARIGEGTTAKVEAELGTVDTKPEGGRCIKLVLPDGGIVVGNDGAVDGGPSSDGAAPADGGVSVDGTATPDAGASDDAATAEAATSDDGVSDDGAAVQAAIETVDAAAGADVVNGEASSTTLTGATYSTVDCYNHYRKQLTLTTEWVEYKIRFSEMHQDPNYGYLAPFAIDQIYSFAIAVPPSTTFDVWIDDLAWWRTTEP
jgi:hypothetical protein